MFSLLGFADTTMPVVIGSAVTQGSSGIFFRRSSIHNP